MTARAASSLACALVATLAWAAMAPAEARQGGGVSDGSLRNVPAQGWLTYGRDYANSHFSPLSRINTETVSGLRLAWTYDIGTRPGRPQANPLVSNGVLYATGAWSVVFAVDARTGEEKWRWDPALVSGGADSGGASFCCGPVNRGVALWGNKVYAGLLDGRLVALDAETGHLAWVRQTTPVGTDYSITGAPRVVNGKVIIGNGGAEYGVRGFVTAYDAETGDEVWRFYTVPGNPALGFESQALEFAAGTWTGEWWILGGGGTVWDAIAYDAEADLLYIGVGNGSPWSRDLRSPGGGDNLYLSSIVALRPDTGEYVWHFQTTPGDDWDFTATQNIVLADLVIDGVERKVLMQAPKNGFFYVLDRLTGEFISAGPFGFVTWARAVHPETGVPIESAFARYGREGQWIAPGPIGAHNWEPMSFSPQTGLVYIPGQNNARFYQAAAELDPTPGQWNLGLASGSFGQSPLPEDLPPGFLLAWDPVAQEEVWRVPIQSQRNAGTLATAGNLVFSGQADGTFFARNAETGDLLWSEQLAPGMASPSTFELDGRQYVTILAGSADARVWTFVLD